MTTDEDTCDFSFEMLDFVCIGGSVNRANEDVGGWSQRTAWIIDGATSLDRSKNWNPTSSRWIASAAHGLMCDIVQNLTLSTDEIFAELSRRLANKWSEYRKDESLIPPAASAAIVRVFPSSSRLELAVLGDCVIVCQADAQSNPMVVTGEQFVAQEEAILSDLPNIKASSEGLGDTLVRNRLRYIHGPPRLVLSIFPDVVESVARVDIPDPRGATVLVASDGFARAIEVPTYGQSWANILRVASDSGLTSVLRTLREWEDADPAFTASHYKESDDAAAALLRIV